VLAVPAGEVADILELSVSSVNSLLHRGRRTLRDRYAPSARPAPDAKTAELLRRYVSAWEAGDVDALLRLLKADAVLEMPPIPVASVGHESIRAFLAADILDGMRGRWRGVTTEANGGPAVGLYQRDGGRHRFTGLQLIGADGYGIARVTAWMDPSLAQRFRLPAELPA
jgi:RNA polymerase sigma-70 factor (ECF subfamily)